MNNDKPLWSSLPLGIKLIWLNQVFAFSGLLIAAFGKQSPIILGPWLISGILANAYMALMLVSQGFIIKDFLLLKRSALMLVLMVELLSLAVLFVNLFITQETLDFINKSAKLTISMSMYRFALMPSIIIQFVVLFYLYKKQEMFK